MKTIFDQFTGQYSLSKTLRFELIPQGKTKELIEKYRADVDDNFISNDEIKAKNYPLVKQMLDDYYRDYINEVLLKGELDKANLCSSFVLFEKLISLNSGSQGYDKLKKEYTEFKKGLRESVSSFFSETDVTLSDLFVSKETVIEKTDKKKTIKKVAVFDYKNLFKQKSPLFIWLKNRLDNGFISIDDYKKHIEAAQCFINFSVYFTKYKNNRENLFKDDAKASSIAYRMIDENMEKFF